MFFWNFLQVLRNMSLYTEISTALALERGSSYQNQNQYFSSYLKGYLSILIAWCEVFSFADTSCEDVSAHWTWLVVPQKYNWKNTTAVSLSRYHDHFFLPAYACQLFHRTDGSVHSLMDKSLPIMTM